MVDKELTAWVHTVWHDDFELKLAVRRGNQEQVAPADPFGARHCQRLQTFRDLGWRRRQILRLRLRLGLGLRCGVRRWLQRRRRP